MRVAVQGLKLFFIAACDEGGLGRKRQRLDAAAAAAAGPSSAAAPAAGEEPAAKQLQADYASYTARLAQLLSGRSVGSGGNGGAGGRPASPSLQVAALTALMECARHEEGPGTCSGRAVGAAVSALVQGGSGGGGAPEALALFVARYMPCLDVRYHALKEAQRLAARLAEAAAAAACGGDGSGGDAGDGTGGGNGAAAAPRTPAGAVRTLFDVLAHAAPIRPGDDLSQFASWCGAAEAGLVAAAADAAESAKARRKRKAAQLAAANGNSGGAAAAAAPTTAAWANAKAQQRAYGDAWLALLRLDLPGDIYKKVLLKLHSDVLAAMADPALLADFLTASLDRGGLEGMLALNGIFTLVTRHGLEYPAFYKRLYGLLTPEAFLSRHRLQFFRLADIFLSSALVPAYTAAAFAKRLARLALRAPPAGAMVAVGFIHNLVRRHPSCIVLLHRPVKSTAAAAGTAAAGGSGDDDQQQQRQQEEDGAAEEQQQGQGLGADPYDESEPDPARSRAVESSLWELAALRRHYCPQVSTLAAVLDKDLSDRAHTSEVDLDPLLAASYGSLISGEIARRLKAAPVAFYARPPARLFGGSGEDGEDGGEGGRASELAVAGGNAALLAPLPGWDVEAMP